MQEEINRQREIHNRVLVRDPVTGRREYREGWRPGDKGYLPPATEFITIRFRNGVIVMPGGRFQASAKNETEKTDAVVTGGKKYVCKTD